VKASLLIEFTDCQILKRYHHLAWCRCHTALDLGLAVRVYTLSPPLIVRPTAYRDNNVRRHFGYFCVRLLTSSWIEETDSANSG
jgi:hypothetical protein